MAKSYYGGKYEPRGYIFSGRKASSSSRAYSELQNLNKALLRAGLEPVRAEGRSTKAYQEAQEKARGALEEEERRKERERLREEEEEERSDRARRFAEFNKLRKEVGGYSALFEVLTPDEAAELREYDSGDMVEIGAAYLGNPEFSSVDEAATAYYAQQQRAFDDMASGDYDADFSGVPFF